MFRMCITFAYLKVYTELKMMREALFIDRIDAARKLVPFLKDYKDNPDVVILGLPRGGMVLADYIARELNLPLDFIAVKKVPSPSNEEVAIGALSEGDLSYLDWDLIANLGIPKERVDEVTEKARKELNERTALYRAIRPAMDLSGKTIIIVDDGIATGASMCAAVSTAKDRGTVKIIVAVPVASTESLHLVKKDIFQVVCPFFKEPFWMVGEFYSNFSSVEDSEVVEFLKKTRTG